MMKQTFLACLDEHEEIEWLQGSLVSQGQVLRAPQELDSLLTLIDATGASLVFISLDRSNLVARCSLIESLLEASPLVVVVAVGNEFEHELLIAAMRAGARDFISHGQRSSEVLGLVRRMAEKLPQHPVRKSSGGLYMLYGALPHEDAAFVATHLAQLWQRSMRVLLVDLGVPNGLGLDVLGLEASFTFDDAMRNLRRMDRSLIDNAFLKHRSGLVVLPAGDQEVSLTRYNSSELFLMFSALRNQFDMVLLNASGQPDCEPLRTLVGSAEQLIWYTTTRVTSCRRNLALLDRWRAAGVKLEQATLLLDQYSKLVSPESLTLQRTFELPLRGILPGSHDLRLKSVNRGAPIFEIAPRDPLSKALQQLLGNALPSRPSVLARLSSLLSKGR